MAGPIKRSVTIAGHATSVSLEPVFWEALEWAAVERAVPLNALIADIDAERSRHAEPANLASALRVWAYLRVAAKEGDQPPSDLSHD